MDYEPCQHENVIFEEIEGISQTICSTCGDIIDYKTCYDSTQEDFRGEGKNIEDIYVPLINKDFHTSISDENIKIHRKILKYQKMIIDILNKLKIDISQPLVQKTALTFIDYLNSTKKVCCTTAILLECLIFNVGPQLNIPSIKDISLLLGINLKKITRAKNKFKEYCLKQNFRNLPNTHRIFEKVTKNKSLIIDQIKDYCNELNYPSMILQISFDCVELLEKCNALPFSQHRIVAIAISDYVNGVFTNDLKNKKLKGIKINPSINRLKLKLNSIISILVNEMGKLQNIDLNMITWYTLQEALKFSKSIDFKKLNYIRLKHSKKFKERIRESFDFETLTSSSEITFKCEGDVIADLIKKGNSDEQIALIDTSSIFHKFYSNIAMSISEAEIDKDVDNYIKSSKGIVSSYLSNF